MEITYTKHGDYYYPDLALPPQPTGNIGRFGRMRKKYLKANQPDTGRPLASISTRPRG